MRLLKVCAYLSLGERCSVSILRALGSVRDLSQDSYPKPESLPVSQLEGRPAEEDFPVRFMLPYLGWCSEDLCYWWGLRSPAQHSSPWQPGSGLVFSEVPRRDSVPEAVPGGSPGGVQGCQGWIRDRLSPLLGPLHADLLCLRDAANPGSLKCFQWLTVPGWGVFCSFYQQVSYVNPFFFRLTVSWCGWGII